MQRIVLTRGRKLSHTRRAKADLNQAEDLLPARFFASSGSAISKINSKREREEEQ